MLEFLVVMDENQVHFAGFVNPQIPDKKIYKMFKKIAAEETLVYRIHNMELDPYVVKEGTCNVRELWDMLLKSVSHAQTTFMDDQRGDCDWLGNISN